MNKLDKLATDEVGNQALKELGIDCKDLEYIDPTAINLYTTLPPAYWCEGAGMVLIEAESFNEANKWLYYNGYERDARLKYYYKGVFAFEVEDRSIHEVLKKGRAQRFMEGVVIVGTATGRNRCNSERV